MSPTLLRRRVQVSASALRLTTVFLITVACAFPVAAQSTPTCNVFSPNSIMRAESYSDVMGDLIIQCTGGTPTALGQRVPPVTLTVFVTAPITSKITGDPIPTLQSPFTEVLALIDEPNSSFAYNAANPNVRRPLLACGSTPHSPYDVNNVGVCSIISDGSGMTTYIGYAGHPNVFQGRVMPNTGGTGIQFVDMPIDPPGPGNHGSSASTISASTPLRLPAVTSVTQTVASCTRPLVPQRPTPWRS